ncbi:lipocalin-like domain-containing protein [Phaeobacter sp.]|uniref:lipocalin-like domain-containing protein n=1 Tax=Phaeobacter sp. TaxID=1902409 RepID=UPI0025E48617|nr:lipocalin-like domain-containing protein [Phaeobacter sp.]
MNASSICNLFWAGLLAIGVCGGANAQGYAGLGTTAEGFAVPQPNTPLRFPQDHAAHPEYRIEWWYLTANLTGVDGQDYGIQWTLFRSALRPGSQDQENDANIWSNSQIWMGHAGLTTAEAHYFDERLSRGGLGIAGVEAAPFRAFIDDWHMTGTSEEIDQIQLFARGDAFAYDLSLIADGPLVLQGNQGYSVKSAQGQASYYYSQPHYRIRGTLQLPEGPVEVTGDGWLDREWSSQPLAEDQSGWDWFSLRFDDGTKMMGFQLRGTDIFTSGTWIAADGSATPLEPGVLTTTALSTTQVEGRDVPTRWRLQLPERDLDITVEAMNANAWMGASFPYWEGPVRVSGSATGIGYLEMTGY